MEASCLELGAVTGPEAVEEALGIAAVASRFDDVDLAPSSII